MTGIQWTERTWNPVVGCTPVSPGCLNCYAATMARRLEGMGRPEYQPVDGVRIAEVRAGRAVFTGSVRTLPDRLGDPLKWRKPQMVFVNSMSDLFHESVPQHFIHDVLEVMRQTPRHTYQVLTKRPERAAAMDWKCLKNGADYSTLPNLWLGTSVERQKEADERIPWLLKCPAAIRFLSCEPLLEEVVLPIPLGCRLCNHPGPQVFSRGGCRACGGTGQEPSGIDWVIVGGESGPKSKARPFDVHWASDIVDHCHEAGVPVFVKQMGTRPGMSNPTGNAVRAWGETKIQVADDGVRLLLKDRKGGDPAEWPEDLRVREFAEVQRGGA